MTGRKLSECRLKRVVLIVLDSCGCGGAPDAEAYGDAGANTLGHTATAVGGLELPNLQRMGLGNIETLAGVPPSGSAQAAFGRMHEVSAGKDTTTGHWEIAGLQTNTAFATFPDGFPKSLIQAFAKQTGRDVLGNKAASGTAILQELGEQHLQSGSWIVYTSADSVFQIAAHEEVVDLQELYVACKTARELCDPLNVGRVIARPFIGRPGTFERTHNRHDFSVPPPAPTMLDALQQAAVPVIGVGKIGDIFSMRGIDESISSHGNADGLDKATDRVKRLDHGLLFVNLIEFDSKYGHRRDPVGFAACLAEFDAALPRIRAELCDPGDLLILTADHGNDPTYRGTDHTREAVPLLVSGPGVRGGAELGVREGFFDVAASIVEGFGLEAWPAGRSMMSEVLS